MLPLSLTRIAVALIFATSLSISSAEAADKKFAYAATIKDNVNSDVIIEKPNFLSLVKTNERLNFSDLDMFCLAKNIFHEAGSESQLGKYAVAQVTINRTKDPTYPQKICAVVMDPYQFSWTNNRENHWFVPEGKGWEQSKKIAYEVLMDGKRVYGMDKTLYFHNQTVIPLWARTKNKIAKIGGHIFYNRG